MNLLITLLAAYTASAIPNEDMECASPYVVFTSPSIGQTDVALDVVPAIGMSNDSCDVPEDYVVSLRAGDAVLTSNTIPFDIAGDRLLELSLEAPLDANTEYTLAIEREEGWGELTEVTFTTGEGTVVGLQGTPSIQLMDAILDKEYNIVTATYEVTPAEDANDLSILQISEAGTISTLESHRSGPEPLAWSRSWRMDKAPDSLCLVVTQRDGTGSKSDPSAESCIPLEVRNTKGCSALSAPTLGWFLPLAVCALVRRRSQ